MIIYNFRAGRGVSAGRGDRRRGRAGGGAAHDPGDHQLVSRRADQEQPQPHLHAPLQEGTLPALHDQPRLSGPLSKSTDCKLTRCGACGVLHVIFQFLSISGDHLLQR